MSPKRKPVLRIAEYEDDWTEGVHETTAGNVTDHDSGTDDLAEDLLELATLAHRVRMQLNETDEAGWKRLALRMDEVRTAVSTWPTKPKPVARVGFTRTKGGRGS